MLRLKLHSLNVGFDEFLLLLYHATGRNFVFEARAAERDPGLEGRVFAACADVHFEVHRILADEAKIEATPFCRDRETVVRRETDKALAFLRLMKKYGVSFSLEDDSDMRALLRVSPPLAEWVRAAAVKRAAAA